MISFIFLLATVSLASADVSELLFKPQPFDAQPHEIIEDTSNYENPSTLDQIYESVLVEQPAAVPFGALSDGVEIIDAVEVLPAIEHIPNTRIGSTQQHTEYQLTGSHPDYQGPYQYEKPQIPLEYGAPEAPKLKDQPIQNDYLPPLSGPRETQVKRNVRYFVRRRV
ncbi:uncharacterized protein LOC129743101 [Uranotaenia lowii]|uniref:uncharacterized protein LOC129743101 n=1 Tax=Uranotaenia lowii TaxID=190385 RepID=UPI00247A9F22|nr:uncharacterized protein LOC129743101 [Uranotaenia lowii]